MKTLDEVIEGITKQSGLEIRNVRKPDKDRFWVDRETYMDALHYLKEYQEKLHILEVRMAEYKRGFEQLGGEWSRLKDNPPLTWDELKGMTGKPVWVERPEWKEWLLVSEIDEDKCEIYLRDKWGNGVIVNGRNIGYWRAYRKERE